MHLNSVMLIIQSIFKTALIMVLVLLGLGTLGAVIGFSVAVLIAGITGILLVYTLYRSLPKPRDGQLAIVATIKTMLKNGLPISIGAIVTGFLTTFYTNILAVFVTDNSLIGNYSVAVNFVVLISFVATPVTTMLLPAFSKLDYKRDREVLKNVFQYSVKYAALIVVPVTLIVMSLAQPAISTIFQNKYTEAPLYLALSGVVYLLSIFGSLSYGNLINSQGDTNFTLKLSLLQAAIGFPLSFVLISQFGIIGLIVTSTIVGVPGLIWSLIFIKRRYSVTIDWVSSAKILASSSIAAVVTYIFATWLPFSSPIRLILGVIVFALIFLVAALLTRTISHNDIANVRQIAGGLGPLSKPLGKVLDLLEKFMPKQGKQADGQ
jgi:O-antigen/teichoic acid export membrane protein